MASASIVHELPKRLRLRISGDRLDRVAAGLTDLTGVAQVSVNRACRSLTLDYDGQASVRAAILERAEHPPATAAVFLSPSAPGARRLFLAASAVAAVGILPAPIVQAITLSNVAGTLMRGIKSAAAASLDSDLLDALAIGLATMRREYLTANITLFLIKLATYIEATTAQQSNDLLRSLLQAPPNDVWVQGADGEFVRTPFSMLKGGERIRVGTGETIPVDGWVVAGDAYVDQSRVTGESLPLPLAPGDQALAGCIVTEGRLEIRADRVGEATTTGRITRYILDALDRPSEIQAISTTLADQRVGITLGSATAVFALTRDWRRLESVFMVDYACAVKLGTPIAIKSAMYWAARDGCLVRSGSAIEALASIDTIVFDKTGTLTHNTLQVTDVCPLSDEIDEESLVALVASVAEHTNHPIANTVVRLAKERHLAHMAHEEVNFIVGHGVEASVNGRHVRLGSRHYLEDDEQVSFARQRGLVRELEAQGKSLLYVAVDDHPLGVFALQDRLREESASTLKRLRAMGVKHLVMITGDHSAKALALQNAVGMDAVFYEQQPEDKARIIAALKQEGRRIAYVGDGVNDGPALVEAHVGISMPRAADIARATADIVLLEDRLDSLATLLENAQTAIGVIRSNFRIAVGVNTAILGAAASGWLSPIATATLHNSTTIAVLLHALFGARPRNRFIPTAPE